MSELQDKLEGKTKEVKGKVTGNRSEELKGKTQEVWGAIQGKMDDLKDQAPHSDSNDTVQAETMAPAVERDK